MVSISTPTLVAVMLAFFSVVVGKPNGAPKSSCQSMLPDKTKHGSTGPNQNFGYKIDMGAQTSFQPGKEVTVKFNDGYKGFLIQARAKATDKIVGTWKSPLPADTKYVVCSGDQDSITHTQSTNIYMNVEYTWVAPNCKIGSSVIFKATLASSKTDYQQVESSPLTEDLSAAKADIALCGASLHFQYFGLTILACFIKVMCF